VGEQHHRAAPKYQYISNRGHPTVPFFSLVEGQTYVDYDLIYIYNDMLFNGSKNVDERAFDKSENRPTNLQIPLVRQQ